MVLIANNDSLQTEAIKLLLERAGYSRICETDCGVEAEKLGATLRPSFGILGYTVQPDGFARWIDKMIRVSNVTSLILVVPDICSKELITLVSRRVSAILHIADANETFIPALAADKLDEPLLSPRLMEVVGHTPPDRHPLYLLSKTELKIAALVLQGLSNKLISSLLFRSLLTIEDHRKHIKNKLCLEGGKNALIEYLVPFTNWVVSSSKLS